MGQYYKPVFKELNNNVEEMTYWLHPHRYDSGAKLMEHSYVGNSLVNAVAKQLWYNPMHVWWSGDYADPVYKDMNRYQLMKQNNPLIEELLPEPDETFTEGEYIWVNLTKHQSVYCRFTDELTVDPLPLLTAEGNGRGGGDYRRDDERVGTWAGDIIMCIKPPTTILFEDD